ncbi:MAG: tRNA (adenosine(37)-N6)-dimethylallyltransferase MiaA [Alphaproteobacteria bacterium]|nr:tRNA (adenosine(37)-N6)-dimethylallyltransferase MiaA [Alphaproteobacteria bacterium]
MARIVVIGGPTASGKSAVAARLAEALSGTVINADALQVYAELEILTARPSATETARLPHRLYGVLSARERCTAARWRGLALTAIDAESARGRVPILVGGTGLYIRALLEGLSEIPAIPESLRVELRAVGDSGALHRRLAQIDPLVAARLRPSDRQRVLRALEVKLATGRGLAEWHAGLRTAQGPEALCLVVNRQREELYARCDARFAAMIESGALDEIDRLANMELEPSLPAMKAIGVRPLLAYRRGESDLATAIAKGQQETRNYAKRQLTWFRHQLKQARMCDLTGADNRQFSERFDREILPIIRQFLLTSPSASG